MSFRSTGASSGRADAASSGSAFEGVRRSLLQRDGLPFAEMLTAERLSEAFAADGVDFSNPDDPEGSIHSRTRRPRAWAFRSAAQWR